MQFILIKKVLKRSILIETLYIFTLKFLRFFCSKVYYFLPIYKDVILLQSYEGRQFSCNPKYIADYINTCDKHYKIIVAVLHTPKYKYLERAGYRVIKSKSLYYYYYYMTAKFIVFNDFFPMFIPHREKQVFINTWHGGGAYKHIGALLAKNKFEITRYLWKHDVNYAISSCAMFSKIIEEAFGIKHDKILEIGMPRNDLFFNDDMGSIQGILTYFRDYYKIDNAKKIVLYAPTYRENQGYSFYGLDFKNLRDSLQKKFGGEWLILFRGHYFLQEAKDALKNEVINVSDYDDMQEILLAADCLITDYSSSVWDYSLTGKPCFLYTPDLEAYKKEIGFYYPIEKWPFSVAMDNAQLRNNILKFNEQNYITAIKEHHKILGSFEHGNACQKVVELIRRE